MDEKDNTQRLIMLKKSFTLIEILVVIVVIGIISSFIIVGLSSVSGKANIAKGQAFSNSLRNSLLMNLVSEWKLDGNANDSWGTNNGTNNGAILSSDCISKQCYFFDGASYISTTNSLSNSDKTMFLWVKPTISMLSGESVFAGNVAVTTHRFYIGYNTGNFWIGLGTSTSSFSLLDTSYNKWHNFVLVSEGSTFRFYQNGFLVNSSSWSGTNEGIINIGRAGGSNNVYFTGLIDEVQIYDKALSSFQIKENYFIGLNKLYKNNGISSIELKDRLAEINLFEN